LLVVSSLSIPRLLCNVSLRAHFVYELRRLSLVQVVVE
jgi:hypothetical protein